MENRTVNCAEECVNGCVLGEDCPHREHLEAATKFMQNTSMDDILAIADERLRKKFGQVPEQYMPDLPSWNE